MVNYINGKIFKIVSEVNGQIYIGSTVQNLNNIHNKYKFKYRKWLEDNNNDYYSVYKLFELGNTRIEVIINYPCDTREELVKREMYYINEIPNVNIIKPHKYRTSKWYKNNLKAVCLCDSVYRSCDSKRHFRTKKHQLFISNL